ncbi:barstar family protein [Streptomyces sp. NBC_01481]|uniref:barstar family protein n=1 Tax=Streptomyces sp. NBC_01481 TaxID=2975869 RepID=UPI0022590B1A|nr:barstar family protein [Streptomyces sp. NBC_01481]MCX4584531.1 barstar family protein [Streptomyces sp. NBC_01481]
MSSRVLDGCYSIYSVDDTQELFVAGDLVDFFVDSEDSWRTFLAVRNRMSESHVPREVADLEIRVLDSHGETIGSYSLSDVHLTETEYDGGSALRLSGYVLDLPHPHAPAAWARWREGAEPGPNAWVDLSPDERDAWLDCARLHSDLVTFPADAGPDSYGGTFSLDGSHITDRAGLYCAFGEALRGPGGYFGSTLDALRDCLGGGFGVRPPFTLHWRSVDTARTHLGEAYVDMFLNALRSANVSVIL